MKKQEKFLIVLFLAIVISILMVKLTVKVIDKPETQLERRLRVRPFTEIETPEIRYKAE